MHPREDFSSRVEMIRNFATQLKDANAVSNTAGNGVAVVESIKRKMSGK